MADTMQFDLVSPERSLASLQAVAVRIPGAEGDMTAMPGHAPTLTTLRPGVLRVEAAGATSEYVVTGGFAEISATSLSVLAEKAVPVAELTRAQLDELVADLQASAGEGDAGAKLVADLQAVGAQLGL